LSFFGESAGVGDGEESNGNSLSVKVHRIDGVVIAGGFAFAIGRIEEREVLVLGVIEDLVEDLNFFDNRKANFGSVSVELSEVRDLSGVSSESFQGFDIMSS
jgi:hypothetical protein